MSDNRISLIGLGLCIIGGLLNIAFWIYQLALEMSYGWGNSIPYIPSLIIGVFVIIGAIIGQKVNKNGYLLSIGSGLFVFIYLIILGIMVMGSYFLLFFATHFISVNILYPLGAIFSIVGAIIGAMKS